MRRSAAFAAAGAVALVAGFTITHLGIQDRTPAGHRASSQALPAVGSFTPSTSDESRLLAEIEQREAERLETERLEREAREEAEAREAEAAELARVAAVRAEKARKAAEALSTPTTVRAAPVARTPVASGDSPPDYIKQCESGGDYTAVNPSGYYGAWQFSMGTWASVGGTGRPDEASPAEQDYRAALLWNGGRGASHWSCA